MVTHNALMRIFWPSDLPNTPRPGVIVGWRNSELDVVVVTILHDVEPRSVDNALRVGTLFRGTPHPVERILGRCGRLPLQVLGTFNPTTEPLAFSPLALVASSGVRGYFPLFHCPADADVTLQIVSFDKPNPHRMQYLSLTPISLTLGDMSEKLGKSGLPFAGIDADEEAAKVRKHKLVEKLRLHTVTKHPRTQKELALPVILDQINCSFELSQLLQKNIGLVGIRSKRSLSVSERVVESAANLWDYALIAMSHAFNAWIWPVALQMFTFGLIGHRAAGEVLLKLLEWRPVTGSAALKDVSATAQQVDIRLQQFCYWPVQYLTLRQSRNDWESVTNNHPEYIRFYNSLWLVANDVIIGIALGSYIIENAGFVAGQVDMIVDSYFVDGIQHIIAWLMDWPAGLKLNKELGDFLGDLFLWVIEYWAGTSWHCLFAQLLLNLPYRLHVESSSNATAHRQIHRLLKFRRRKHAHFAHFRSPLTPDAAYIFILHCLGAHLQLATHNHHVTLPSLPRKEAQRPSQPHRLLRLRPRPASPRHDSVHASGFSPSNGWRFLRHLCQCTCRHHYYQSCA